MADRCKEHPWGTCDGCGVDLGAVCCYSPHQFGDYGTLCHSCFTSMKQEAEKKVEERLAKFINHDKKKG